MNNEIKEIKIGMYSTDEILEFMTNGEGRGFMGRSMYDAILDYITNLQQENKRLKENNMSYQEEMARTWKITDDYKSRIDKATIELFELKDMIYKPETRDENIPIQQKISSIIKQLNGRSDE